MIHYYQYCVLCMYIHTAMCYYNQLGILGII